MFQEMFGCGSTKVQKILDVYPSPDILFSKAKIEYENSRLFTSMDLQKLSSKEKFRASAERILEDCEENNIKIITYDCEEYTDNLRNIYSPPLVLYYKGDISLLKAPLSIGIVGTREPTEYGVQVTAKFCEELSDYGVVTVSGLAMGIDAVAHKQTLINNGKTIGVLGSGLCNIYPLQNKELARIMVNNGGLVLSEFPPKSPPSAFHFPIRNRIISGISNGVLVVEGARKSGSLITAGHATVQGKDVFVVPGSIFSAMSEATNWLARQGAIVVTSGKEIIEEYSYLNLKRDSVRIETKKTDNNKRVELISEATPIVEDKSLEKKPKKKSTAPPAYLNDIQREIYLQIRMSPITSDEISRELDLPVQKVLTTLTQLELYGLVEVSAGRTYSLV